MKFALCEFVLIAFAVFMAILNRRNRAWLLFWLGCFSSADDVRLSNRHNRADSLMATALTRGDCARSPRRYGSFDTLAVCVKNSGTLEP